MTHRSPIPARPAPSRGRSGIVPSGSSHFAAWGTYRALICAGFLIGVALAAWVAA